MKVEPKCQEINILYIIYLLRNTNMLHYIF